MKDYHKEFEINALTEEQQKLKAEAVRRMEALSYFEGSIWDFESGGAIMVNEPPNGGHYYIDDDKELVEKINEFETQYNAMVYAVIRAFTNFGVLDSFLFVDEYEEEWPMFDENLPNNIVFTYTWNRDVEEFSDMGSIGFEHTSADGLIRRF